MGELVFNGGMLAFFLAMTANCMTVEIWEGYVGARYWPLVLLVIADALFLAKTVGIYRKLPKSEIKADFSFMKSAKIHRLLLAFIATIAYVAILEIVGYVIATILYGHGCNSGSAQSHQAAACQRCDHACHLCDLRLGPGCYGPPRQGAYLLLWPVA